MLPWESCLAAPPTACTHVLTAIVNTSTGPQLCSQESSVAKLQSPNSGMFRGKKGLIFIPVNGSLMRSPWASH
jgi:hypothetical protein